MDLWFTRHDSAGTRWCVRVSRPLCSAQAGPSRIEAFETEDFGAVLAVDGSICLTESEGFAQREMMVHPAMCVHPAVRSVLVVGGGDGNLASELLRYPGIDRIAVTEDDEEYARAARQCFPALAAALEDPRVTLSASRGDEFARDTRERFDLILVAPRAAWREGASSQSFYCDCFRALSGDGILVAYLGSAFFPERRRELVAAAGKLKRLFPIFRPYAFEAPANGSGASLVAFASKKYDPLREFFPERWERAALATSYYDADQHRASFALPRYVAEAFRGA